MDGIAQRAQEYTDHLLHRFSLLRNLAVFSQEHTKSLAIYLMAIMKCSFEYFKKCETWLFQSTSLLCKDSPAYPSPFTTTQRAWRCLGRDFKTLLFPQRTVFRAGSLEICHRISRNFNEIEAIQRYIILLTGEAAVDDDGKRRVCEWSNRACWIEIVVGVHCGFSSMFNGLRRDETIRKDEIPFPPLPILIS